MWRCKVDICLSNINLLLIWMLRYFVVLKEGLVYDLCIFVRILWWEGENSSLIGIK